MNRDELLVYKGITGFSLGQVEKDYLQHIILSALSRNISGVIAFKGGTALQKTGIISRFSEDLDFTARNEIPIKRIRTIAHSVLSAYNYPVDFDNEMNDERTVGFRMKIQGPLYRGKNSLCTLRIEVSKRESILLPTQSREITPLYSDVMPYLLDIMHMDEIAAEKVKAILTRDKPRDLYDLYHLSGRNVTPSKDLIDEKLGYYGLRYDTVKFMEKCERFERRWGGEMRYLVGVPPAFDKVMDEIRKLIERIVEE